MTLKAMVCDVVIGGRVVILDCIIVMAKEIGRWWVQIFCGGKAKLDTRHISVGGLRTRVWRMSRAGGDRI
jgi:hypothetical protein